MWIVPRPSEAELCGEMVLCTISVVVWGMQDFYSDMHNDGCRESEMGCWNYDVGCLMWDA